MIYHTPLPRSLLQNTPNIPKNTPSPPPPTHTTPHLGASESVVSDAPVRPVGPQPRHLQNVQRLSRQQTLAATHGAPRAPAWQVGGLERVQPALLGWVCVWGGEGGCGCVWVGVCFGMAPPTTDKSPSTTLTPPTHPPIHPQPPHQPNQPTNLQGLQPCIRQPVRILVHILPRAHERL